MTLRSIALLAWKGLLFASVYALFVQPDWARWVVMVWIGVSAYLAYALLRPASEKELAYEWVDKANRRDVVDLEAHEKQRAEREAFYHREMMYRASTSEAEKPEISYGKED